MEIIHTDGQIWSWLFKTNTQPDPKIIKISKKRSLSINTASFYSNPKVPKLAKNTKDDDKENSKPIETVTELKRTRNQS